jgi:hypothetical protein
MCKMYPSVIRTELNTTGKKVRYQNIGGTPVAAQHVASTILLQKINGLSNCGLYFDDLCTRYTSENRVSLSQ